MTNNTLNERLVQMGLGHWARPGTESLPAALDLLPWWALVVRDPERDSQEICDLPSVIAATFGIERSDSQRIGQSISILKSAIPIPAKTLPELCLALSKKAVEEGWRTRTTSGTAEGILWMLGFLANQNDQNGLRKLFVDTAIQILLDPSSDESNRLARVISLISVRYGFEELAAPLAALVDGQEPCLAIEIPGALACLGEPGHRALLRLLGFNGSRKSPELQAAIAACFEDDFDGLLPFLESDRGWQVRASTARLLCHLARAGKQPAAVLEMLLSRARVEQDCDTISVMTVGIGIAVQKIGKNGVEAVLATLQNQFGDGSGHHLIDGLLLAGPEFINPIDVEALRMNHDNTRGVSLKRRRAINRILSWQEGYPVCVADWATDSVYRLLQWEDLKLPLAVQSWFSATPDISLDQLIAGLFSSGRSNENHGFAIAQVLRRGDDHRTIKAIQLACVQALATGQSKLWSTLCGVLAGCWSQVALHPAELRAAFGVAAGTPLQPDWAAAGRLLNIASSPVKQAQGALILLAGMGTEFRDMARHALATTPPYKDKRWSLSNIPIAGRLGSQELDASAVGGNPIDLCHPMDLTPESALLFDRVHPDWTTSTGCFLGLQVACFHQADFSSKMNDWNNTKRVEACLQEAPVIQVQRAILAAVSTDDAKLNQIGLRLAHHAPESALEEGPLGPLVAIHRQRARANGIELPTPPDDDDEDLSFESLEEFLEF